MVNFPRRETVLYRSVSGEAPVERFLDSLSARQAQRVTWVLRLVTELGVAPAQYFKKLSGTEEIWEVRVRVGRETLRLLGFFDGPHRLVLTCGFAKKSAAVPAREIALAERRRREYLGRRTDR